MTKPDAADRRRPGRRVAPLLVLVLVLTSAVSVGAVPASTNQTSLDAFAEEPADISAALAGRVLCCRFAVLRGRRSGLKRWWK